MKCSKARRLLSDYIDGNLKERESLQLEKHLQMCVDCRKVFKEFQSIVGDAKELKAPVPSENVWRNVKARLEKQKGTEDRNFNERVPFGFLYPQARLRFAVGAILLTLLVGGVFSALYYLKGRELGEQEDLQKVALKHLAEAELHYQLAIDALNKAISEENPNLNAPLAVDLQKNLEILDASIRTCGIAIQEYPDNLETWTYLLTMYKKKITLLNEIMKIKTETL